MSRVLTIRRIGDVLEVDEPAMPGSPPIGRGVSLFEALGSWFHANQDKLGFTFDVDTSAQPDENKRRRKELARR